MSNQLIKCKACEHEIAKNAKSCPHCGAKNKKKSPVLWVVIGVFLLIALIGSMGNSEEPQKVEKPNESQIQTEKPEVETTAAVVEKEGFEVGETAALKNVEVTLVGVYENEGSAYNKPTEGNVFVLCEFEIVNNSTSELSVSSMMSFSAYCDDYACTFSLTALMEKGNKNQLDGVVAPGKKFNGVVGYEVPANWQELEIHFTPDYWSGKEIIFIAANNVQ